MCASALSLLGVSRVVYGAANDRFGGCGSVFRLHERAHCGGAAAHHAYDVVGGVERDAAVELLRAFYARRNPDAAAAAKRRRVDDHGAL